MEVKTKIKGVVFSEKDKQKNNPELQSDYQKRINDLLHRIEFTEYTPNQAFKTIRKLQGFLRKKRSLKPNGTIYIPRTETGKRIINGKVIKE